MTSIFPPPPPTIDVLTPSYELMHHFLSDRFSEHVVKLYEAKPKLDDLAKDFDEWQSQNADFCKSIENRVQCLKSRLNALKKTMMNDDVELLALQKRVNDKCREFSKRLKAIETHIGKKRRRSANSSDELPHTKKRRTASRQIDSSPFTGWTLERFEAAKRGDLLVDAETLERPSEHQCMEAKPFLEESWNHDHKGRLCSDYDEEFAEQRLCKLHNFTSEPVCFQGVML